MSKVNHDVLVAEIHRVSKEKGIPVTNLVRDKFRDLSPIGKSKYVQLAGAWTKAKRAALGLRVDFALEAPPVDPIPPGMVLKGVSTYQGADGSVKGQWTLARKKHETREEVFERLLIDLPGKVKPRNFSIPSPNLKDAEDILAVYPMGDPHLGLLAWKKETLDDDFDIEIAERLLRSAVDNLTLNHPKAAHALIVNLGDFFHADGFDNKTRRSGHVLDVDSRWPKVLGVGLDVMIHMIDRCLQTHNTVKVINEIGNHDDHSAIMLSIALDRHFRNEPRVDIDLSPARFHYHVFGKNLIGVTHGHSTKHNDLESIMAYDMKNYWSQTEPSNRFWYVGHIHHSKKQEYRNCMVESFRTLAPNDAWASEAGYRSGRDMNRIALHRRYGEIARSTVSAVYLQETFKEGTGEHGNNDA